jgi:hypothetical protein
MDATTMDFTLSTDDTLIYWQADEPWMDAIPIPGVVRSRVSYPGLGLRHISNVG